MSRLSVRHRAAHNPHVTSGPGDNGGGRLSAAELAARVGVDSAWVERVADAGAIDRGADGSFGLGDVHRVRLLNAFDVAGVPLDTLLAASRAGRISLRYYDELHPAPSPLSGRTYAEFAASLDGRRYLAQLFAAFGIAEPDADVALTVDDEATIGGTLEVVVSTGAPDLALRAVRMFGEGARRAADAALGIYGEAVGRLGGGLEGLPEEELFDRQLRPWARIAVRSGELSAWLAERHLSRAIDDYSIVESERILLEDGYVERPLEAPPAIAFVDLTGFTRLTEERGDEVAAAVALRLGDLTVESVAGRGGRVVKLLGDGVLIRFDRLVDAVEATLDVLSALPGAGLPSGHAGVTSGPLIARDGDVFGRTVNMAARIADAAPDGRLWVPSAVGVTLSPDRFTLTPVDPVNLQGIGGVPLVDVARPARPGVR